jgi:integrase
MHRLTLEARQDTLWWHRFIAPGVPEWAGRKIIFHTDCQGMMFACGTMSSKDSSVQALLRCLSTTEATCSFVYRVQHIVGAYKSALHTHFASQQSFADHGPNPLSHPKLQRLLTGISNSKAAPEQAARLASSACQPLTFDIVPELRAVHGDGQREVMIYAAIATAMAAALRPSELLGSSEYPSELCAQVRCFYNAAGHPSQPGIAYCTLRLEVSKTNQRRRNDERVISAPEAVQALGRWITARAGAPPHSSLFEFSDDKPLTTNALIGNLRRKLKAIGRESMTVTGRSFRKGGASTLAVLGVPAADIVNVHGWANGSSVWREHYAHFPDVKRARAVQVNAQIGSGGTSAACRRCFQRRQFFATGFHPSTPRCGPCRSRTTDSRYANIHGVTPFPAESLPTLRVYWTLD